MDKKELTRGDKKNSAKTKKSDYQKKSSNPPNQTLYINNLNDKLKVNELKTNLYHLFSEFGDVIEINARKSKKMKGQAFVVFKDIPSATNAKLSLNGSLFFGKELHIDFANSVSDIILKITNSLNAKEKVKNDLERKRKREEEYNNV